MLCVRESEDFLSFLRKLRLLLVLLRFLFRSVKKRQADGQFDLFTPSCVNKRTPFKLPKTCLRAEAEYSGTQPYPSTVQHNGQKRIPLELRLIRKTLKCWHQDKTVRKGSADWVTGADDNWSSEYVLGYHMMVSEALSLDTRREIQCSRGISLRIQVTTTKIPSWNDIWVSWQWTVEGRHLASTPIVQKHQLNLCPPTPIYALSHEQFRY